MSLTSFASTVRSTLSRNYLDRFMPVSWFDFYSSHRLAINSSVTVTFLGVISYAVYRFFFGRKRKRNGGGNSVSEEDEEDLHFANERR